MLSVRFAHESVSKSTGWEPCTLVNLRRRIVGELIGCRCCIYISGCMGLCSTQLVRALRARESRKLVRKYLLRKYTAESSVMTVFSRSCKRFDTSARDDALR